MQHETWMKPVRMVREKPSSRKELPCPVSSEQQFPAHGLCHQMQAKYGILVATLCLPSSNVRSVSYTFAALCKSLLDWLQYVTCRDGMMRWRGPIAPPGEIVLVAIDEASIARFGQFPWPRSLMAQTIDQISAAQPRVIALDVLYTDPTNEADDRALAGAIARAGNVVVAAQLIQNAERAVWLRPLRSPLPRPFFMGYIVPSSSINTSRTLYPNIIEADPKIYSDTVFKSVQRLSPKKSLPRRPMKDDITPLPARSKTILWQLHPLARSSLLRKTSDRFQSRQSGLPLSGEENLARVGDVSG